MSLRISTWKSMAVLAFLSALALAVPFASGQSAAAKARAGKPSSVRPGAKTQPLTERERAAQMLSRFTFGTRPGDVDRVAAMGADKWFEQQLDPAQIRDAVADRRMQDYPTLTMSLADMSLRFPDRGMITRVAQGKAPYPTDPMLAGMYEVLVAKYNRFTDQRDDLKSASGELTDEQRASLAANKKQQDTATANRVAGDLLGVPKIQRMAALMKVPVQDRIAFVSYVNGDARNLLMSDFAPREKELFAAMASDANAVGVAPQELQQARIVRDILSERQLQEVMTDFWLNHFNIFIYKDSEHFYTTAFERDVIRPHALGKFRDLLMATATSPAMMIYLDNWTSIGPNSIANGGNNANGKRNGRGLNENYAREVMELHTVGVNGGYTQADVTQLARILTGWTVDHPELGGGFVFDPKRHEPGPKQWFGHIVPSSDAKEGQDALNFLASQPQTAHFISYKLAQRFVADEPPPALVDRMAQTFISTDGDIKAVLRALIHSPEFNSRQYFRNKVKTPVEFVASAFRSTMTDPANPGVLTGTIQRMGEGLYQKLTPDGYNITASAWMNSTALIDRLNFALALTGSRLGGMKFDAEHVLAMGLMAEPANGLQPAGYGPVGQPGSSPRELNIVDRIGPNNTLPAQVSPGANEALALIENALVNGEVSAKTNKLIREQIALQSQPRPATAPAERPASQQAKAAAQEGLGTNAMDGGGMAGNSMAASGTGSMTGGTGANAMSGAGELAGDAMSGAPKAPAAPKPTPIKPAPSAAQSQPAPANPVDTLNTLTAMVLGSPEFQLR